MTDPSLSWPAIFDLWRNGDPLDTWEHAKRIAADFPDISSPRTVVAWLNRQAVPMERWEHLMAVLERRWGIVVSERQLVRATVVGRASRGAARRKSAA